MIKRAFARLLVFSFYAFIPLAWGAVEVATGDGGGWVLIAFGVAAGIYGVRSYTY